MSNLHNQVTSFLKKLHAREIAAAEKRVNKPVKILKMEVVAYHGVPSKDS